MKLRDFIRAYPYDPFDDWGIAPGPQEVPNSLQNIIRKGLKRYPEDENAVQLLPVLLSCLPEDSALRHEALLTYPSLKLES